MSIKYDMGKDKLEGKLGKTISRVVIGFSILETEKSHALMSGIQEGYSQKISYSKILPYDLDMVQAAGAYTLPYASAELGTFGSKPFRINVEVIEGDDLDKSTDTNSESKEQ